MATITSSGSISGLDVNALVTKLVAAERAPYDTRLTTADTKLTTQFSALAQLKGAMSSFQAALTSMKQANGFDLRKTTVGDEKAFTATATSAAAAGTYDVQVQQLAKAAQLGSAPFVAGPDAIVGTGTLTLSMGATAFTVDVTAENNTLSGIRDAINNSEFNPGVRATLLRGVDGARLVITGSATGAANAVSVTATGGDGGLQQLSYDPLANSGNGMTAINPAQDAIAFISGYEVHGATNTLDKAVDGVSLTLLKADPNVAVSLSVANDDSGVKTKVDNFVSAYNVLAGQIAKLRSYDAETKTAGPLLGDSLLLNIETQMRRIVSEPVSGSTASYTTLASLGVTSTATGTLTVDAAKLQTAIDTNPAAVSGVFSSETGLAGKLYKFLGDHLSTTGDIASRDASITARRKDLNTQATALDARMVTIQARYQKQFTALDALLTKMQSTSTYLAAQLSGSSSN